MSKDFSIDITGGIGKNIMATSFIKWLSEEYPDQKITVISSFPEIFEYNPRIWRNLRIDMPYLFEDYLKKTDYRNGEPYQRHEYYDERKHLMEVYPLAYGFKLNENPQSEIFLTQGEKDEAKMIVAHNNPLITMQVFGGVPPGHNIPQRKVDMGQRDMPMKMAQLISRELMTRGYKVMQIRNQNEPIIPGTLQINLPFRNIIALASEIKGHIGIDSAMMHAVAVFKKPMMTFWSQTHVDNLGYKYEKSLNKFKKGSMQYRPAITMPDREGVFPYRDRSDAFAWDYSNKEIIKYINEFDDLIKNKK